MRTTIHTALATAALLLPSAWAQAQTVIGLTNKTPLVVRQSITSCRTAACKPVGHAKTPHPASGGTAFDATRKGVWITSGSVISLVDPLGCRTMCRPTKLAIGGEATGLAMYEPKKVLLVPTTADVIYTVSATCPPRVLTRCNLRGVIPAGWKVGGIAVDDARGLVFFTASNFGVVGTPMNVLYVAPIGSPCKPICKMQFRQCNNGVLRHVTGAAYDPCKRMLYVTDGFQTSEYSVADPRRCQIRHVKCCPLKLVSGDSYIGLAVLPTLPRGVGKSCTQRPCTFCPTMRHELLGGLPTLANSSFSLDVVNAPRNALVYMFVGLGPCSSLGFPFGCGRIHVSLTAPGPIPLGPISTGAGAGCTGSAKFTVPIPPNPALCGRTYSSQGFVLCKSAVGLGHGLTNCQTWTITGS